MELPNVSVLERRGTPGDWAYYHFAPMGTDQIRIDFNPWMKILKSAKALGFAPYFMTEDQFMKAFRHKSEERPVKATGPDIIDLILEGKE